MAEKYIYELEMKVRDYECDLQGIVNNANYQHYLEHTRHEFLTSVGISFAALHEQGVDPVVARISMAFKTPLKSGDEFISKLYMKKEGIKYVFYQDIFRKSDGKVSLNEYRRTNLQHCPDPLSGHRAHWCQAAGGHRGQCGRGVPPPHGAARALS